MGGASLNDLGMTEDQAKELAAEANDWYQGLVDCQPTAVRFAFRIVDAVMRTPDGPMPQKVVRMYAYTPCGPVVLHLPPDVAETVAHGLIDHATYARSGLVKA